MTETKEYKFSEIMEGFFDGPHATPPDSNSGPIFLGIKNIKKDGGIDHSQIRHISEKDYPRWIRRVEPKEGDLVFSYEATLHKYALIPKGFRGCLGRRMALIRPKKSLLNSTYLFYHFLSPFWKGFVESIKISGSTVDRISITDFPKYKIILPPLPTQNKIASILSTYDDLIENNNQRIQLLEEMAGEIYKEWFVRLRFPGYEETRFLNKKGEVVAFGTEGALPEGWERVKVEHAFETLGGGTPSTTNSKFWKNGTINWYSPTDLTSSNKIFTDSSTKKITEFGLNNSSTKLFPPYSVMMTSRASIGSIGINLKPSCVNQGFIVCIPNDSFPYSYLFQWLKQNIKLFMNFAGGATFLEISRTVFRNFKIVKPNKEIITKYNRTVSSLYEEHNILTKKNHLLQQTRDLLLPRLISGKLKV